MVALIEKINTYGEKSTFTIVGRNEDEIDSQVYELTMYERRDSTYPQAKFRVLKYDINNKTSEV